METEFKAPASEALSLLTLKAREQLQLERDIEDAEELLKQLNARHRQISQTDIPNIMKDLGMAEFKLTDGSKVTVTPFYAGKITTEAGYTWLKTNGHGSMVKAQFEVPYDFGAADWAIADIKKRMFATGFEFTEKKTVHHMTLGAFIKEQDLAGTPVPTDLFSVFSGFKTKIK